MGRRPIDDESPTDDARPTTRAKVDTMLVTLTRNELGELIDTRVRSALREEIAGLVEPRFLTVAEVADMLQVCTKTVANLVKREGLPVVRQLGRELRFERDALVAWMRARENGPGGIDRPRLRRGHLERLK